MVSVYKRNTLTNSFFPAPLLTTKIMFGLKLMSTENRNLKMASSPQSCGGAFLCKFFSYSSVLHHRQLGPAAFFPPFLLFSPSLSVYLVRNLAHTLAVLLCMCVHECVNVCISSVLGSANKPPLFDAGT